MKIIYVSVFSVHDGDNNFYVPAFSIHDGDNKRTLTLSWYYVVRVFDTSGWGASSPYGGGPITTQSQFSLYPLIA
jgi:hypothetical protein